MLRKISLFNGGIFRSDVKRFWWFGALFTLAILLTGVMPFYLNYYNTALTGNSSTFGSFTLFPYFLTALVSPALSVFLFGYLHQKAQTSMVHAYPVKRRALFFTHTAFGMCTFVVSAAIIGVVLVLIHANPNIAQVLRYREIAKFICATITTGILLFSAATFVGMFCANPFAHYILTFVMGVLPLFLEAMGRLLASITLYGFADYDDLYLLKYYVLPYRMQPVHIVLYLAASIILLFAAFAVYRARNLEHTENILAFPRLKIIFVYGVGMCFGLVGYGYFNTFIENCSLFWMLPFCLVGIIIANMLSNKSLSLKGAWLPFLCNVGSIVVLVLFLSVDISGFAKRLPDPKNIDSIIACETADPTARQHIYTSPTEQVVYKEKYVPIITDEAGFAAVRALHEHKISTPTDYRDSEGIIYITYRLKNGKTMRRSYHIDYETDYDLFAAVMDLPQNMQYRYPLLEDNPPKTTQMRILANDNPIADLQNNETNQALIQEITDALIADLKNVRFGDVSRSYLPTYLQVEINTLPTLVYEGDNPSNGQFFINNYHQDTATYVIRPFYKNTLRVLTAHNLIAVPETYPSALTLLKPADDIGAAVHLTLTEPTEIKAVYNYAVLGIGTQETTPTDDNTEFTDIRIAFGNGPENDGSNVYGGISRITADMPEVMKSFAK